MRLLKLAFRNLFRNTRRTVLTVAAIGFGLSLMIYMVNFQKGSYGAMIDAGISSQAGHVVVQADGYQEEKEVTMLVDDASAVASQMQAEFPDAVVAPRIFLGGLLMSSSNAAGVSVQGLDAVAEPKIQKMPERVVEGTWLEDDDREILLGRALADSLEVTLGDKVVFMGQNGTDEVESRMFRVKGIFRTGSDTIDGRMSIVHLAAAQELMGGGDVAHMVTLHIDDPRQSAEAAEQLDAALGREGLDVLPWKQAMPELAGMIEMDRASGDGMMLVIGIIVAFGVLNTLLMSVMERTREFGVMLSLGMKPRQVAGLVLTEGVVIGCLGALVGLGAGLLFSYHAIYVGIDYGAMTGTESMEMEGIVMDSVMKGAWSPTRMVIYLSSAVVFCFIAALYPAYTISKLQPVEAMRHH